ncbi:MAG: hypothetical protein U0168_16535 [Nannocystaceae bacterium]
MVALSAIVEALYQNPNCRMSVVHRMLEFAVRGEHRRAPAQHGRDPRRWPEVQRRPERDDMFRRAGQAMKPRQGHRARRRRRRADESISTACPTMPAGFDLEALLAQTATDDLSLPLDAEQDAPVDEAVQQAAVAAVERAAVARACSSPSPSSSRWRRCGWR